MKRVALIVAAIALPMSGAVALAQTQPLAPIDPNPLPGDAVVATVNGASITVVEVLDYLETLPQQYRQVPVEKIFRQVLERVIDQRLLAAEARKAGVDKRAEVKRRVTTVTDGILQEVYLQDRISPQIEEAKLRSEYQKRVANEPKREEVHARHILVDNEADAKQIIAELKSKGDFIALAKTHSKGPSAANGGDLGYFPREAMVPEFAEAAFAMKDGEISKAPVKTQFGWHVIKVEGRRQAAARSFEEMAGEIRQELGQAAFGKIIDDLRGKAKVTVKEQ